MGKPIAVLISDVHYTPTSLPIAHAAMKQALDYAEELGVPLVDCGDLLDSKAILRAECVNAVIELFSQAKTDIIVLGGNHTLLNEKSSDHSLHFLKPYCLVIDKPTWIEGLQSTLIPYQNSSETLQKILNQKNVGDRLIMHQGVQTAFMGHYVQDKTSLPPEAFAGFRVLSGHYHRAQDIRCGYRRNGCVGLFSYVGTPYTTSFSEALDGPKGFQVLYDDGSLELIPTNLRKHVIVEASIDVCNKMKISIDTLKVHVNTGDLVWLKVKGTHSELANVDVAFLKFHFSQAASFKLEKIYTDTVRAEQKLDKLTDSEILDTMIERTGEGEEQKAYLKSLWREIM